MRTTIIVLILFAAVSATSAFGRPSDQPKHETVSAVFSLTPAHRSGSASHVFTHATVGFASTRLTVPRGVSVELLIRTPVESATGQPPDIALCTPAAFCRRHGASGLAALHECRESGAATVCEEVIPRGMEDALFQPGAFTMTVREFKPTHARVSLRVTFVRGPGA